MREAFFWIVLCFFCIYWLGGGRGGILSVQQEVWKRLGGVIALSLSLGWRLYIYCVIFCCCYFVIDLVRGIFVHVLEVLLRRCHFLPSTLLHTSQLFFCSVHVVDIINNNFVFYLGFS